MTANVETKGRHTPGPWQAGHVGGCTHDVVQILTSDGRLLFNIGHCRAATDEQMRPNANLIAAAPDLLAALQEMVRLYGNHGDDFSTDARAQARAALAKALPEDKGGE